MSARTLAAARRADDVHAALALTAALAAAARTAAAAGVGEAAFLRLARSIYRCRPSDERKADAAAYAARRRP